MRRKILGAMQQFVRAPFPLQVLRAALAQSPAKASRAAGLSMRSNASRANLRTP